MNITNYSYSKLDCYQSCGFKFKLKYIEKNFPNTSSIALDFGTLVHNTEEEIANCLKDELPIDYIKLKNNFILSMLDIQHRYKTDFMTLDKSDRTYLDKMYQYLDTGIYRLEKLIKENPGYTIIGAEIPFKVIYKENYTLNGKIDRIIKDSVNKRYIIQDIKTYAVPVEEKQLVTPLQFVFYSLAAKELGLDPEYSISCQYDLPLCDLVQDAGTQGFVQRGTVKMDKLFDKVNANIFEPSPSPLCHYCEFCATNPNAPDNFKLLCPYHSNWTKEYKTFSVNMPWCGEESHEAILQKYVESYNQ